MNLTFLKQNSYFVELSSTLLSSPNSCDKLRNSLLYLVLELQAK